MHTPQPLPKRIRSGCTPLRRSAEGVPGRRLLMVVHPGAMGTAMQFGATGTVQCIAREGGRVRRGLTAPRSRFDPLDCPGIGRPVGWDDLIQSDSEQFRTVPRTQAAVAGTLNPSSGDAPRRTRGRRERDHDAPHSPSAPHLAVPGIGFPQNFSVAQDVLDSRAFRDWSDDRFDAPPQPIDRIAWRPSPRQWLAARW
jgi:hypothetical protein